MKKDQLRKLYKQKRLELPEEQVKLSDQQLLAGLQNLDYNQISFLHVYLSIRRWKEYDTMNFITWMRKKHPSTHIVISKSYFDTGLLRHFVLDHRTIIKENEWGIPEPINAHDLPEVAAEQLDMVLVPLLACDRYGNRLGYGKGFYDRFLKKCRADVSTTGISYFDPIADRMPTDPWDVPLNRVVCPQGVVEFIV